MNIHKQDIHSVFSKVFQAKSNYYLALTVMSAFLFDDPGKLLDETDLWNAAGSALSSHDVLDMFMPKQKGEILAAGKFFSPGRRPVRASSVRISVGSMSKVLHVFGDRRWIKKAGVVSGISDPQPMTEMEITYVNAFGGPGYKQNPLGKGMEEKDADGAIPLSNIEYPDQLIGSPSDRPEPAGFGPLGLDWQQRAGKLGTYDQKWIESRWPWFPEDMDWTYFNAAPGDQIIGRYFRGDEKVVIENMHPEHVKIETTLPGFRMRCFIEKHAEGKEIFKEVKTRLDTIWLFPEQEMGVLIWRAVTEVKNEDAEEISAVFVPMESLKEPPETIEYYRTQFLLMGKEEETPEEPEPVEEEIKKEKPVQPPVKPAEVDPETRAMLEEMKKELAESEANLTAELKKLGLDPEELIKELPISAAAALPEMPDAGAELSLKDLEKELAGKENELKEMLRKTGIDPDEPMKMPAKISETDQLSMKDLVKSLKQSGAIDEETEKHFLEMEKEREDAEKKVDALLEEDKKREAAAAKAEEKLDEAKPEEDADIEKEEVFTREKVVEGYQQGMSFAGKDLTGLDLSGFDLPEIDLKGAMLEKVNFSGSNLAGADLSDAVLTEANFSKTKLTSANLAGSNFSQVQGQELDMSHSNLSGTDLSKGNFEGANFANAQMDYAVMDEAKLKEASFEKASAKGATFTAADLTGAIFLEADVTGADFSDAIVQKADFSRATAHPATFDGAKGEEIIFTESDLRESRADENTSFQKADIQKADLSGANWEGADLTSAKFRFTGLDMADFTGCKLQGADFYRSVSKQANFSKADLTDANMISINLFRGNLSKARLIRTNLKGSNLFEVEFLKATVKKADFHDANLKRTKLAGWVPK